MSTPATASFKDMSFQVRCAGVVLILGGALAALLALLYVGLGLFGPEEMAAAAMGRWAIVLAGAFYGGLGALLLALGVGLVLLRRWGRALGAAFLWLWLVDGLFTMVVMAAIYASERMGGPAIFGPGGGFILIITSGVLFFLMIALPAGLLWAVAPDDARATCEAHDLKARWTDRHPISVLVLALLQLLGVLAFPILAAYPALPFFDRLVGRPVLLGLGLVFGAYCAAALVATLRHHPFGWWAQLGLVVVAWPLGLVSVVMTSPERWAEVAKLWGGPAMGAQMADAMALYQQPIMLVPMIVMVIVMLVFLLAIRKHFRGDAATA